MAGLDCWLDTKTDREPWAQMGGGDGMTPRAQLRCGGMA